MNSAAKTLLTGLLLLGLVGGAYYIFFGPNNSSAPSAPSNPGAEQRDPEPPKPPPGVVQVADGPNTADEQRREIVTRGPDTSADADQGVQGRVLLPNGSPAAGIDVFLIKASTADPLQFYIAHKLRQKIDPVGQTATAEDGTFRLGVDKGGDKFDLRIVSDYHPELNHKSIRIRRHDWYDTGDLVLELGKVIRGVVVSEETGQPIPEAMVYLTNPNLTYQMLPTPGRERGIPTETNDSGFFRFDNAPAQGLVTIGAEAPGFAYAELTNQQIKPDELSEFTLKLAPGMPIAGVVVNPEGKPIRNVTVTATGVSVKLPQQSSTTTEDDGTFLLPMMRNGPYNLAVTAAGYEDAKMKHVMAGDQEVKLVLEQRGRVRLRVLSSSGVPLKSYTVSLKRYFPNNPNGIGKVPEFRNVRVTPADFEGEFANIRNVPNGEFLFQIIEKKHAKTLTEPFQMASGEAPPEVSVTLTLGGAIRGQVVDDAGAPVAGATVVTDMNGGIAADTGFFEIFRKFMPDKHTTKETRTNQNGEFYMSKLAFADYMLRVAHPDFCEGASMNITLETEGQEQNIGIIQLMRGAVVEGVCRVGGNPSGQIKVSISPPEGAKPPTHPDGTTERLFSATAITDSDGYYRFSRRVPPGTYRIHAFKEAGKDDIFAKILAMKQTQRNLVIRPGQNEDVQNFELPAQ
ncbi:MAG: carboxypeptidase-like regulatory domain-containing protein [Planctomycetota bacterium]|nr:carboxypeptidase-like regulatory domain-containing protein [Planctomycetota bacterium]